ncbi:hypothetical protein HBB16_20865, partial [Pseudonocardia sp. MCCB 268]|nr:hypothetical protein [Pseudonocardia cytotoxica]
MDTLVARTTAAWPGRSTPCSSVPPASPALTRLRAVGLADRQRREHVPGGRRRVITFVLAGRYAEDALKRGQAPRCARCSNSARKRSRSYATSTA